MKRYLCAALLCASVSSIAQDPFLTGDALGAAVKEQCANGCVVLTREDAAFIDLQIQAIRAQAFEQGSKSCRNAI
jgi:hypothetical protein